MISGLIRFFKNRRFITTLLAGFFSYGLWCALAGRALACVPFFFLGVGSDGSAMVLIFPLHSGTPLPRIHLHILNFCMVDSSISDCRGFQFMPYATSNFETTLFHWRCILNRLSDVVPVPTSRHRLPFLSSRSGDFYLRLHCPLDTLLTPTQLHLLALPIRHASMHLNGLDLL